MYGCDVQKPRVSEHERRRGSEQKRIAAAVVGLRSVGTLSTEPQLGVVMHPTDDRSTTPTDRPIGRSLTELTPGIVHGGCWLYGELNLVDASGRPHCARSDDTRHHGNPPGSYQQPEAEQPAVGPSVVGPRQR